MLGPDAIETFLFHHALQSCPVFVMAVASDGRLRFINETMSQALGYEAQDLIGCDYLAELVVSEDQALVRERIRRVLEEDLVVCGQTRLRTRQGTEFAVEWHGRAWSPGEGQGLCYFGVGIDITERNRAQAAQKQAEARVVHLNAVLRGIRGVNQLINRERDRARLLQQSCETLVASRGFYSCCIVQTQDQASQDLACAGALDKQSLIQGAFAQGKMSNCARLALGSDAPIVCKSTSERCAQCPMVTVLSGGKDGVALRLAYNGTVYGVLLISLPQEMSGDPEEQQLLCEMAGDLGHALYALDIEEQRQKADRDLLRNRQHLQQTTESLRISEERYRTLFETMAQGVVYHDTDGRITAANPAAQRILGLSLEQLQGRTSLDPRWCSIHEDGSPFSGEEHPSMIARLQGIEVDNVVMGVHNPAVDQPRWLNIHSMPLFRPDQDKPYRVYTTFEDITERKQAEEALRQSEQKARAMYKRLPLPTFVWQKKDDDLMLVDFNDAAWNATGGRVSKAVGVLASQYYRDRPDLVTQLHQCLAEQTVLKTETEYVYTNGDRRSMRVTYGPVPPDLVLVHTEDITEQRRVEEQLRLSQKMEAIGRLAGGIAHDFNNLLTVINSYATLASDALLDSDPLRGDLLEIGRAGERAAALTRQLLAFGRKQMLQPQVLNLNKTVTEMQSMLRRLLGEDVELVTALAPDLGNVLADPSQLEQVLMNLALNARDAMPHGGTLTVETANAFLEKAYGNETLATTSGPFVVLMVSDTGAGMDPSTKARIFEPFFTTKETGKGTGLGLATVYGIVQQSGGNIWVESEPGRGTTFKVYLPQSPNAAEAQPRGARSEVRPCGRETLLLVEDEEAVRNLARRVLTSAGYQVLVASNGGEALLTCERYSGVIHLMLTDVVMPQMSGRELAQRVSKLRPSMRVLFTSGYTDDAIVHHGVLEAGTHFIAKPFSALSLTRKVREVLDAPQDQAYPADIDF